MERLTVKNGSGYLLPAGALHEAAERLGRLEDMTEAIHHEQQTLSDALAQLKTEGKTKTLRFREMMARRITLANTLDLLQQFGL